MARPLRLSFENAVYHITARGNRKENIFYSDKDKNIFLEKMKETFNKYSFICYAYCLMNNHYHLFIKTPNANISDGMHYLNSSYANWLRTKYKIVGTIFQGRYKSIIVDENAYALMLSAYIHLNPLRAGMVKQLEEYPWSSFIDYAGVRNRIIEGLDIEFILSSFDNNLEEAKKKYVKFVINNIDMENPLDNTFKGVAIGNKLFIDNIKEKIAAVGENREIKETKVLKPYSLEDIITNVSSCFSVHREEVLSKKRGNIYRQLALYLIKRYTPASLKEAGKIFDMDYAAVSSAAKRFDQVLRKNTKYSYMVNNVLWTLRNAK